MTYLNLENTLRLDKAAIRSPNLADRFTQRDLSSIAECVVDGYEKDKQSRFQWFKRTEAAMDLAMQVVEERSFPWPNASNVTFPLVTIAALQFHARAYPAIIQGEEIIKCRIAGGAQPLDVDRAYRIGKYMSYQVLEEDSAWEEQHDRLLLNISIVGCAFKKSFYDGTRGHNVSQLVLARDLVVDYHASSIEAARRKTHVVPIYRNDIFTRARTGIYRDVTGEAWFKECAPAPLDEGNQENRDGTTRPNDDYAAPFRCLEQHVWLDLDGDGYEEPYIVLVEESSRNVLRIVSRVDRIEDIDRTPGGKITAIRPAEYFTKYGFIPSPDGGLYDIGFGVLLGPLNESVNSLVNQLIDAGTMANTAGGFLGRGAKIRGGNYSFTPMEWKRLDSSADDIKKAIFPLPVREPSAVLFNLLSLLIEYTNRISGATEMLAGENPGQNTKVGTVDQMVEQGLKIYGAIFKRVWRSMKEEFKKLYVLNAIHMPAVKSSFSGVKIGREDFLGDPNHIVPCADPNVTSDKVRVSQAVTLSTRASSAPGYNIDAVEMNLLRALRVDSPETFYVGAANAPMPNPKMAVEQEKTKREQMKLRHQAETVILEIEEQHALNEAKISQLEAQATALLAEAKGVNVNQQIGAINAIVGAMKEHNKSLHDRAKVILESVQGDKGDKSGAIQHLVGRPGDKTPQDATSGMGGGAEGGMGNGGSLG